jgi:hypothetical protein
MAYDVLGSLSLAPIGIAIAGPLAEVIGTEIILDVIAGISLFTLIIPLLFRDVRMTKSSPSAS